MKLSTKGRYGVRVLLDLAGNQEQSHVSLSSIAQRQSISARYLQQITEDLRRAGYIRSVKGAKGGYVLAQQPKEIIVGDVLRLMEGDISIVEPSVPKNKLERCILDQVFTPINERVANVVDKITIQNLLDEQQKFGFKDMFFI